MIGTLGNEWSERSNEINNLWTFENTWSRRRLVLYTRRLNRYGCLVDWRKSIFNSLFHVFNHCLVTYCLKHSILKPMTVTTKWFKHSVWLTSIESRGGIVDNWLLLIVLGLSFTLKTEKKLEVDMNGKMFMTFKFLYSAIVMASHCSSGFVWLYYIFLILIIYVFNFRLPRSGLEKFCSHWQCRIREVGRLEGTRHITHPSSLHLKRLVFSDEKYGPHN